jgi:Na+/H+-dicarboxylate symporter
MELAPFGVFALIAVAVGSGGLAMFTSVLKLGLCVVVGAAVQTLLVHGSLLRVFGGLTLLPFLRGSRDAILIGFSTASSSATLPVAMEVAEHKLGVSPVVSSTVLPLGATLSMDGTAMYMAMLAMFALQSFGIEATPATYVILGIAIVTLAMGTAPIPSSSLFLMAAVLGSVGIPPEKAALLVSFILPFDRPLDMIRTIPNVTSDLSVAATVARAEGHLDLDVYRNSGPAA